MDNQKPENKEQGTDFIELINKILGNKWVIIRFIGIAVFLGILVGISIPNEFTAAVKMIPEGNESKISGSMSNIAALAGINIGTLNSDGLNQMIYPDIVQSTPFMVELVGIKINECGLARDKNLYYYLDKEIKRPWWSHVVQLPAKLLSVFQNKSHNEKDFVISKYSLSEKQEGIIATLKNRISIDIDNKTGIITTRVTLQNAALAAIVADSLVAKLEAFIVNYQTNKAKQDYIFASKVFIDAKQRYYDAQKNYANYVDENKNLILESVRIEQERLKNEQNLAYNVYSNLAQQVEAARLKVQEKTPCVTIIEPARIPVAKSNASKFVILMAFIFLGGIIGIVKVIFSN